MSEYQRNYEESLKKQNDLKLINSQPIDSNAGIQNNENNMLMYNQPIRTGDINYGNQKNISQISLGEQA